MTNSIKTLDFDLTLFSDGGGAGAAAPAGAAPTGSEGTPSSDPTRANTPSGSGRRTKTGALDNVVYGKQDTQTAGTAAATATETPATEQTNPAAEGSQSTLTKEERFAKYKELVESPEYKDIHSQEFQKLLDRRFKKYADERDALTDKLSKLSPVIDALTARYNIQDGDPSKLMAAIDSDQSYWEQAAEEAGMSVEQYKTTQRLMQENNRLKQQEQQNRAATAAQQQVQRWLAEAEEAQATYPGFNLDTEYQNPKFVALLKSGIPVKNAYETIHLDEIKQSLIVTTAQTAEKKIVDNLKVKGARPNEAGTSSNAGVVVKSDPSKLTKADREEIRRRVARGERITF